MDLNVGVMAILVEYPALAAAVGLLVAWLGRHARRPVALAAGVVWVLYAAGELGMQQRWLCSGECNIRIDLLAIHPLLLFALGAAAVSLLRARAGKPPPA